MAKQTNVQMSGRLDNIILYQMNGKGYVRLMPEKVRQTRATKESAARFGVAVRMSKALRAGLAPIMPDYCERSLMHRVNNLFIQSLVDRSTVDESLVKRFDFYPGAGFAARFRAPLSIEWGKTDVTITIPSLAPEKLISAPANTKWLQLRIAVTGCYTVGSLSNTGSFSQVIDIPYNQRSIPAQQIVFPYTAPKNSLSIVVAKLNNGMKFKGASNSSIKPDWHPAQIIDCYRK